LSLNDKEITLTKRLFHYDDVLLLEHAVLCNLNLHSNIYESFANKPELYEAVKHNEWNHVELKWEKDDLLLSQDVVGNPTYTQTKMGIHVSWYGYDVWDKEDNFWDLEKSNKEGDVRFTNPDSRKRKLDEYLLNYSNTSLSQFVRPLKKQRLVEVGVSETEEDGDFINTEGDVIFT